MSRPELGKRPDIAERTNLATVRLTGFDIVGKGLGTTRSQCPCF